MYIITRSPFEVRLNNFETVTYYGVSLFTQYANEMPVPLEQPNGNKFIAFPKVEQANDYVTRLTNIFGLENTIVEGKY